MSLDPKDWLMMGKGYVDASSFLVSQASPVGYTVVNTAWMGAELCLKGVLVANGLDPGHRPDHSLKWLVDEMKRTGIGTQAQRDTLQISITTICQSGIGTDWKYPDNPDRRFFNTFPKTESVKRADGGQKVYEVCTAIVSGVTS
jgi:hypothetical protein